MITCTFLFATLVSFEGTSKFEPSNYMYLCRDDFSVLQTQVPVNSGD